ncbi:MAG: hypothetical protein NT139_03305 [Candidatus Woesearchaeota archaeon]|nr:hypothetical protein [Candidatus Woesearchaeota archaeon]
MYLLKLVKDKIFSLTSFSNFAGGMILLYGTWFKIYSNVPTIGSRSTIPKNLS